MPRTRGPRTGAGSLFAPPGARARPLTGPVYLPIRRRVEVPLVGTPVVSTRAYTPPVNPAFYAAGDARYGPREAVQPLGYPYNYTRNIQRPTTYPETGTLAERGIYLPITMRDDQGRVVSALTGLPAGGPVGTVPTTPPGTGGGGTGGGGTSRGWQVPPGVDAGWYGQFQKQHGGETPEEFYGRNREGLAEALADREWSEGFVQMYGRAPSEEDWNAWYFHSRGGDPQWAAMTKAQRKAERKLSKQTARNEWAASQGYKNWAEYKRQTAEKERPPLYQPPQIYWR